MAATNHGNTPEELSAQTFREQTTYVSYVRIWREKIKRLGLGAGDRGMEGSEVQQETQGRVLLRLYGKGK